MSRPSEKLRELGIELPEVARPVAAYVPWVRHGELIILSGQIPLREGKLAYSGQAGLERTLEEAQQAARLCAINALAAGAQAAGGIDRIRQVLKVVVYVASCPDFHNQHLVANGASELFVEIFGEAGRHARAAVGVAKLPLDATVEIDVTFVAPAE